MPHADIKKADSNKVYISHHILHYDVQCNGEEGDFKKFTMALASKYVKQNLEYDLKDEELFEYIGYLKQMFMGKTKISETFELVVYNALVLPDLGDTIFKDVLKDEHLSKSLSHYGLEPSLEAGQLLKNLKAARVVNLSTDEEGTVPKITAVTIDSNLGAASPDNRTIFVRSFYNRLFNKLWRERQSILIGNPGISKSWFQWYMIC